ncbi:MAG: N-acetylmuramoyl-L-alanine amidase [bacterium]
MKLSRLLKVTVSIVAVTFLLAFASPLYAGTTLSLVDSEGGLLRKIPAVQSGEHWQVDVYEFFQSLNFDVNWNEKLHRLDVSNSKRDIRFKEDTRKVFFGDRFYVLNSQPSFVKGRLYVPAQNLANMLNRYTDRSVFFNSERRQLQLTATASMAQERKDPIGEFIQDTPVSQKKKDLVVMIDPGHGGRDPGAIGANGLQEKQVVLQIARELKAKLDKMYPHIKTRMTRNSDKFIRLKNRTQMANRVDADVFVSIHANSSRARKAKGFEVFTLSGEATDPSARELAEIENSALRYENYDSKELDDIAWILNQLRNVVHSRESRQLANQVLSGVKKHVTSLDNRRMKQAPFWVLKDARMAAILVETGFLSNPTEEKKLQSKDYQEKLAKAIASSLEQFRTERMN